MGFLAGGGEDGPETQTDPPALQCRAGDRESTGVGFVLEVRGLRRPFQSHVGKVQMRIEPEIRGGGHGSFS